MLEVRQLCMLKYTMAGWLLIWRNQLKEASAEKKAYKGSAAIKELNILIQAGKHDIREGESKTNIH